jgi:hypothetical protein
MSKMATWGSRLARTIPTRAFTSVSMHPALISPVWSPPGRNTIRAPGLR